MVEVSGIVEEINNIISRLISNQLTLKEVGILRVSQITLNLEELEFELQKKFDTSLERYIEANDEYPYNNEQSLTYINLMKHDLKIELIRLKELKKIKSKWIHYMNEMFDYC